MVSCILYIDNSCICKENPHCKYSHETSALAVPAPAAGARSQTRRPRADEAGQGAARPLPRPHVSKRSRSDARRESLYEKIYFPTRVCMYIHIYINIYKIIKRCPFLCKTYIIHVDSSLPRNHIIPLKEKWCTARRGKENFLRTRAVAPLVWKTCIYFTESCIMLRDV